LGFIEFNDGLNGYLPWRKPGKPEIQKKEGYWVIGLGVLAYRVLLGFGYWVIESYLDIGYWLYRTTGAWGVSPRTKIEKR
jgi:hypothetical protein